MEAHPTNAQVQLEILTMNHPLFSLLSFLGYCALLFIGKSNLILLFQAHTKKRLQTWSFSLQKLSASFMKALRIDLLLFFFLTLVMLILAFPPLVSLLIKDAPLQSLLLLSKLTLLPIIFMGYVIREFTYCYFLLSPLSLKASLEAGSNLTFRQKRLCFSFGLTFLLISILFTFSFNFVMLSIVALFKDISFFHPQILVFIGSLLILGWYEVWRQALWFQFFQFLAKPQDPSPDTELVTALEKKIPEISGV